MADSDFVKNFLKTYKPKVLDLTSYLRCPKLKGYRIMKKKSELVPLKTYIKYIKLEDANDGFDLSSHIKAGGILLKGGYYSKSKFVNDRNPDRWTHLLLKFDPNPIERYSSDSADDDNIQEPIEKRTFSIKISNYHIFYKSFSRGNREFFEKIDIELV